MFIHLGGERVIQTSELVAIFDISIENSSKLTKQFIQHVEKEKLVEKIGEELPKSLVITNDRIFYSPISSSTLKKRAHILTMN